MDEIIGQLKIKIFLDGASHTELLELHKNPYIKGLTTNPTLMRKEGVENYANFAKETLSLFPDKPISFGVFSDDFSEMEDQALEIASWGENIYIKIPIINTKRESCYDLVQKLSFKKIKLNITAVMTTEQVYQVSQALSREVPSFISIFAGRIADTGRDPVQAMAAAVNLVKDYPLIELIWASPRELFNIFQANAVGCHVITVTQDILKKLSLIGYNLDDYSHETVTMFYQDALAAGYKL